MAGPQGFTEYRVKLGNSMDKKWNIMRFKPPHKCDLEKLVNPTLDRKAIKVDEVPEGGEGSEFGKKRRDESRRKKRGYVLRKPNPDDQPWVLKEKKRGGKHFVGRKEGTVNASSSYYILTVSEDKTFDAFPVDSWYDFIPPIKYNFLNEDEAEEQFEKRNKTLNLFSVMLSKKLKSKDAEDEDGGGVAEEKGTTKDETAGKSFKGKRRKMSTSELLTDSESDSFSSDDSDTQAGQSKASHRKGGGKRKKKHAVGDGAGEETDEGDMESWEVDYMSDSLSDPDEEQAKAATKEVPEDDEEVERQEEGEIDKGFSDSSSSSEDDLTEEGKEINALIKKQSGLTESEDETAFEPEPLDTAESPEKSFSSGQASFSPSKCVSVKREREIELKPEAVTDQLTSSSSNLDPPSKKQKREYSASTITEEEVEYYLSRRPITSKDLVRKFTSKKMEMDKKKIVSDLHQIIKNLKNLDKKVIKGKMFLSLKLSPP